MKSSEAMILPVIIYCRNVEKRKNSALLYTIAITAFIIARIIALILKLSGVYVINFLNSPLMYFGHNFPNLLAPKRSH